LRLHRTHRVEKITAGTEVQRRNRDAESLRAPPRLDAFSGRPHVPHLTDGRLERALERELRFFGQTRVPRYAFSSSAMSSFFILSIAWIAASELPDFGSLSIWPRTSGTICQERPKRSLRTMDGWILAASPSCPCFCADDPARRQTCRDALPRSPGSS